VFGPCRRVGPEHRITAPGEVAWSKAVRTSSMGRQVPANSVAHGRRCWDTSLLAGLTRPSSGRAKAGFASFVPPLKSNVRAYEPVWRGAMPTLICYQRRSALSAMLARTGRGNLAHGLGRASRCRVERPRVDQAPHSCIVVGCPSFGGQRTGGACRGTCGRGLRRSRARAVRSLSSHLPALAPSARPREAAMA